MKQGFSEEGGSATGNISLFPQTRGTSHISVTMTEGVSGPPRRLGLMAIARHEAAHARASKAFGSDNGNALGNALGSVLGNVLRNALGAASDGASRIFGALKRIGKKKD